MANYVSISSTDTTAAGLGDKLVAGDDTVTVDVLNSGGEEALAVRVAIPILTTAKIAASGAVIQQKGRPITCSRVGAGHYEVVVPAFSAEVVVVVTPCFTTFPLIIQYNRTGDMLTVVCWTRTGTPTDLNFDLLIAAV